MRLLYRTFGPSMLIMVLVAASGRCQNRSGNEVKYVPKTRYPVLAEMDQNDKELAAALSAKTEEILAGIAADEKAAEDGKAELRFDMASIERPKGPEAFSSIWHFPPTPQYKTGSCWSFASTSFLESEIKRQHGVEIKLSEMWTVYWEFVEKARRWLTHRGKSVFDHGSEANAFMHIWKRYGVVPRSAYEGVLAPDGRFNHDRMYSLMRSLLDWCQEHGMWEEPIVLPAIRMLLDRTMGRPPESVVFQDRSYTPRQFLTEVCRINTDDYVSVISTMDQPFWSRATFDVPDNWWRDASYLNVPLDAFYGLIGKSLDAGYGIVIAVDVSEPGLYGPEDIGVIPTFDIPPEFIDQSAREFRLATGQTTDDHAVHLVGRTHVAGHDWFLGKDSNRSSRLGRYKGYYMYRDDYVRLKVLAAGMHRDVAAELLARLVAHTEPHG